jgi:hypothetical protein
MSASGILPRVLRWVYVLPFLHLCICVVIRLAHLDKAWGYMFLVDIPMSVIILAISYNFDHPLLLFGTLGTLWWYLLSRAAEMIWIRIFAKRPSRTESV